MMCLETRKQEQKLIEIESLEDADRLIKDALNIVGNEKVSLALSSVLSVIRHERFAIKSKIEEV